MDCSLKKDACNLDYYENLPDCFKKATPGDFYQRITVKDKEGNFLNFKTALKINFPFAVHSFHSGFYYPHRVRDSFDPSELTPWFETGRVFIYSKNDL